MRPLRVLSSRTGTMLFALDLVLLAGAWPLLLWAIDSAQAMALLLEPGLAAYPLAQIVLLYALGLHRREAILSTRSALAKLPLVVALAVPSVAAAQWAIGWMVAPAAEVSLSHLWAAAAAGFTLCGAAARVALHVLLVRGVFRRRIMVIGAGRRAAGARVAGHGGAGWRRSAFRHCLCARAGIGGARPGSRARAAADRGGGGRQQLFQPRGRA